MTTLPQIHSMSDDLIGYRPSTKSPVTKCSVEVIGPSLFSPCAYVNHCSFALIRFELDKETIFLKDI